MRGCCRKLSHVILNAILNGINDRSHAESDTPVGRVVCQPHWKIIQVLSKRRSAKSCRLIA